MSKLDLSFRVACLQTSTGPNLTKNKEQSTRLIRKAAVAEADLVILPEIVNVMDLSRKELATKTYFEDDDPTLETFCSLAKELRLYILVGSLAVKHSKLDSKGFPKLANRSFFIDSKGFITARYDKIHMFDVEINETESYKESKAYEPGDALVLADTPWGKLGMSICYDLRFPQLYRGLTYKGAKFLSVPSAFARSTGKAHWHALIRARAIENGCYVFAAAQCGDNGGGWLTYGHSLIVDPWGKVLVDGGTEIGFVIANVMPTLVDEVRRKIPSITNDRSFY